MPRHSRQFRGETDSDADARRMDCTFHLKFLLATFAGWVNRQQAQVIEDLVEESRVLKEQLGRKLPRLTDDQRRRPAVKGKLLGRATGRTGAKSSVQAQIV